MNTSIIKKEASNTNLQPVVKISRRITGKTSSSKNDLVSMLREENDSLYKEYLEVINRNVELRTIVEKQQKLINAIYNAELTLVFPAEEKIIAEEVKIEPPKPEVAEEPKEVPAELIPVDESPAAEIETPEIKIPQPLEFERLTKRIRSLRRNKVQLKKTLDEKSKLLLYLYHNKGIRPEDLFAALSFTHPTGFRYIGFFRKYDFIGFSGNNRTGRYFLRTEGVKFVQGEEIPGLPEFGNKNKSKIFRTL